jgi:hypothetical protein
MRKDHNLSFRLHGKASLRSQNQFASLNSPYSFLLISQKALKQKLQIRRGRGSRAISQTNYVLQKSSETMKSLPRSPTFSKPQTLTSRKKTATEKVRSRIIGAFAFWKSSFKPKAGVYLNNRRLLSL